MSELFLSVVMPVYNSERYLDIYYYPNLLIGKGFSMLVCYGRCEKRKIDLAIKIHS